MMSEWQHYIYLVLMLITCCSMCFSATMLSSSRNDMRNLLCELFSLIKNLKERSERPPVSRLADKESSILKEDLPSNGKPACSELPR